MAGHIVRHFNRIYSPTGTASIIWPEGFVEQIPANLPVVYDGDVMHIFGHYSEIPSGNVTLKIDIGDVSINQTAAVSPELEEGVGGLASSLSRMAAFNTLPDLPEN